MAFITTYSGEVQLLQYMLNYAPADNVQLHLFNNDHDPDFTDGVGNYTESTAPGYTSLTLGGSAWTISNVAGTSSAVYVRQTFSFSTAESLYGYYITNNASSVVLWAERFTGAPFTLPNVGGTIDVDARILLI